MFSLPCRTGFSQLHCVQPKPTPFLSCSLSTGYTRSPVSLSLIRADLLSFGNGTPRPRCSMLDLAIHRATQAFSLSRPVSMLHLNDVFNYQLPIWSSSPGLPWRELGYRTKDDVRRDNDAVQRIRWFWHKIKYGEKLYAPDSCAFVRSHIVEYGETKVRAVWGYPATITFGEAVFAIPLIEAYQKANSPIAYGFETAVGGAAKIIREMNSPWYYALDFKSFDKTVPAWLIKIAFDILCQNIDFTHYRDYGIADARRSYRMYEYIIDYFINTRIRLCNGERYIKRGGVASGSYFTQLIDSIVNYILIVWATLRISGKLPDKIRVLGDDSIFSHQSYMRMTDFREVFRLVGMTLNMPKSASSDNINDLTFLGYVLNYGLPSRPFDKWITALLFGERRDNCWDDVASRAVGLLYACAGVDRKFDGLCRAIIALKPFDLCLSRGMQRMLDNIGVKDVSSTPPSPDEFLRRLRYI